MLYKSCYYSYQNHIKIICFYQHWPYITLNRIEHFPYNIHNTILFPTSTYCHSSAPYVNHGFSQLLTFHGPNISEMCSWRRNRIYFCQIVEKQGSIGPLTFYARSENNVLGNIHPNFRLVHAMGNWQIYLLYFLVYFHFPD